MFYYTVVERLLKDNFCNAEEARYCGEGRTHVLPFFVHIHLTSRENAMKIKPDSWTDGINYRTCPRRNCCSVGEQMK